MNPASYHTQIDLREQTRRALIQLLNCQLADTLDLGLAAKQAHWNMRGPNFIGLHELFGRAAQQVEQLADQIAERAISLGGVVQGTLQAVSRKSRLPAYPQSIMSGQGHIVAFSSALARYGATTRAAIDAAAGAEDGETVDLFTEVSRLVDKLSWMFEAHRKLLA